MAACADGYFHADVPVGAGTRYRFKLDDGQTYPDPASRYQPDGPHGPSMVIDPTSFKWTDQHWTGPARERAVLYELHVGTFTPDGTWRAAAVELDALADLGVMAVEILPLADFPGRFGWGYDGVNYFAPTRLYGEPDDMRRFVDRAHALGVGVILDVVYNHAGPDGNYLDRFSPRYFSDAVTDWGRAFNFDGPDSAHVRAFFETNAAYWIDEFHLDGLRLDATQQIYDQSHPRIFQTIVEAARRAGGSRSVWTVAENEPQDARLCRPVWAGGDGIDAMWNDDFHHTAMVAATGAREAYYTDYLGSPQEFITCAKRGFLYQGQWYSWQKNGRGTPASDLPHLAFVAFLQNHDQLANSEKGERLHLLTPPGRHRALTALLILGPWMPMLFQGQEFSSSSPFLYFADHQPPLREAVSEGRATFLRQFPSLAKILDERDLDAPHAVETFRRSQIDHQERRHNQDVWRMHRELMTLRRTDPAFSAGEAVSIEGEVIGAKAFVLRFTAAGSPPRILIVNLGEAAPLAVAPYPLLAPPSRPWSLVWSSDDPAWGGDGTESLRFRDDWYVPADSAWVLG